MKCAILSIVLAVMAATGAALGQSDWRQQATTPTSWGLEGVAFISPTHGFICGDDLVLMETTDAGATWRQAPGVPRQRAWTEDPFHDMDAIGPDHIWTVGNVSLRSIDRGKNWLHMPDLVGTWHDIDMLTTSIGFARASFNVRKTTDGGASWSRIFPPPNVFDRANSMAWLDENNGVIWGGGIELAEGLYRTTDGGETWTFIRAGGFANLAFVAPDTILFSRGLAIYKSTDGGETESLVLNESGFQYDAIELIHQIDSDSVAAVDTRHRIWISDNLGNSWTLAHDRLGTWWSDPEPDTSFTSGTDGWLVSESGLVLRTNDGGHSWTEISDGLGEWLVDVAMFPSGRGIVAGHRGLILTTNDFGNTWTVGDQLVLKGETYAGHLNDLHMLDERTGFVVGTSGTFLRTDDGGATWHERGRDDLGLFDYAVVQFVDENLGYAMGEFARKTTDGGLTWFDPFEGPQLRHVIDLAQHDALHGIALRYDEKFAATDDGWRTFRIFELRLDGELEALGFANRHVGWAVGRHGFVLKTEDGGIFWDPQTLPNASTTHLFDIEVLSEQEAYLFGYGGGANDDFVAVFHTTDGGNTWSALDPGIVNPDGEFTTAYGGTALPTGEVWTVGFEGFILANVAQAVRANLTGITILDGVILAGGLPELEGSDDAYLHTEARVTGEVHRPHLLRLRVDAETGVQDATELVITTEGRITDVEAQTTLLLRDWVSGGFAEVDQYSMGMHEKTHETAAPDASRFIRASDGLMRLEIKQIVFFPFTLNGFHTLLDRVELGVR